MVVDFEKYVDKSEFVNDHRNERVTSQCVSDVISNVQTSGNNWLNTELYHLLGTLEQICLSFKDVNVHDTRKNSLSDPWKV